MNIDKFIKEFNKIAAENGVVIMGEMSFYDISDFESASYIKSSKRRNSWGGYDELGNYILSDCIRKKKDNNNVAKYNKTFAIKSFQSFVSPVDGQKITNSKELKEHNIRNNVVEVGTEYDKKIKDLQQQRREE